MILSLPLNIIYRPKSGFGVPLRSWMRNELRELLGDLLSVESLKNRGLFDPASVITEAGSNKPRFFKLSTDNKSPNNSRSSLRIQLRSGTPNPDFGL